MRRRLRLIASCFLRVIEGIVQFEIQQLEYTERLVLMKDAKGAAD
jgi:hypothetical protein